jgi:hypothetical protein
MEASSGSSNRPIFIPRHVHYYPERHCPDCLDQMTNGWEDLELGDPSESTDYKWCDRLTVSRRAPDLRHSYIYNY